MNMYYFHSQNTLILFTENETNILLLFGRKNPSSTGGYTSKEMDPIFQRAVGRRVDKFGKQKTMINVCSIFHLFFAEKAL